MGLHRIGLPRWVTSQRSPKPPRVGPLCGREGRRGKERGKSGSGKKRGEVLDFDRLSLQKLLWAAVYTRTGTVKHVRAPAISCADTSALVVYTMTYGVYPRCHKLG